MNDREVILEYLNDPNKGAHGYGVSVDVLSKEFVDYFSEKTGAKIYFMPYGANKCPKLGSVLSEMYKDRILIRHATGIPGMCGMGFPKWIYRYRLKGTR